MTPSVILRNAPSVILRSVATKDLLLLIAFLLLGQGSAWAIDVTLSEDPDIPVGTAGHWYAEMHRSNNLQLTLTADDLAAGKGTFKVYDDGGKNGDYTPSCTSYFTITVPVGYIIQASGTVWTRSSNGVDRLSLYNDPYGVNEILKVRSDVDGEGKDFGPVVTSKANFTSGQHLTILFAAATTTPAYAGFDMTVTVIENTLYNVNIAEGITHGTVAASPTSAYYDDEITLSLTPEENYYIGTVSYNDGTSNHVITPDKSGAYNFRMPRHDVTVSATFLDDVEYFWGEGNDGSAEHPFVISNKAGYKLLAQRSRTSSYTGKYFELAADINGVTAMIATDSSKPFCGIIDGKGHTVTLALTQDATASDNPNEDDSHDLGCAMILYAGKQGSGCAISNLTVSGTITTTCQWAAGFISYAAGIIAMTDCRSSVTINSSKLGASFDAGFVSFGQESNSSFTFTRCLFDGAFISDVSCLFSGLLGDGLRISDFLKVENCVVVPDGSTYLFTGTGYHLFPYSYDNDRNTFLGYNFWNKNGTLSLIQSQGTQVYQITLEDGATAPHSGTGTVIGNGAATVYADGFSYGGNEYYTQGTRVTLESTPADRMTCIGYTSSDVAIGEGGTFTMPNSSVAVTAHYARTDYVNHWQASLTRDGSTEAKAYLITTPDGLNLLSREVNGRNDFNGKFFKLDADITYSHTTAWNDDSSTENNFTRIGLSSPYYAPFRGTFDGQNHTVSGIRIYADNQSQGMFGAVDDGTVKNVILADTRITGKNYVGGIVGDNKGFVSNCYTRSDVFIFTYNNNTIAYGGIAGINSGTVSNCTSAASITITDGLSGCVDFGGIVGLNSGTVTDCTAAGAIVAAVTEAGAIVGYNNSNSGYLANNTYHSCLVGTNAFNIGVGFHGVSGTSSGEQGDRTGAALDHTKLFLYDDRDNSALITAYRIPSSHTAYSGTAPVVSNLTATLQGHTLYKDGTWNTLCLPFGMSSFDGTPLEGASVYELDTAGTSLDTSTGALTLSFSPVTSIEAWKPYIVKWSGTDGQVDCPKFNKTVLNITTQAEVTSQDGRAKFIGRAAPLVIDDENRNSILFVDSGNKVGYSQSHHTLPAFGAHFWVQPDGTAQGASTITVDFGDGTGSRHLTGHLNDGFYWATYYNEKVSFTLAEGAQAFTMGTDYKLYRLGDDGRTIPAGEAVVIISDVADIELISTGDGSDIAVHGPENKNILHGSDSAVALTDGKVTVDNAQKTPYVLGVANSVFGFHQYTGAFLPAHRAWYVK